MAPARRILHVFSTFDVGGPQIRFVQLVGGFGDAFEHLVIAMNGRNGAAARLPAGAPVRIVPFAYEKSDALRNLWRFRRTLAAHAPDLLVTYNWGAIEWGLVNDIARPLCRHIDVEDGFGPEEATVQLPRRVMLRRFVYRRAERIIVPSRTLERRALGPWRLPREKVQYVPNGVRVELFAAPPDAALLVRLGLDPNEPMIGTVTALRPEKNLGRLMEAFRLAVVDGKRAGKLVVVGDGLERPTLERQAAALGIAGRVTFTGVLDRPAALLGAFRVYALSSDTEQMPISVIEAMAAGLPVAATDVGDVGVMVADANRPYVAGRDAEALAHSLAGLLDDPAAAARLGAANRVKAAAEFTEARMVETWRRAFAGEPD